MLDQLAGEVHKLDGWADAGNGLLNRTEDESKRRRHETGDQTTPDGQDGRERVKDQRYKEPEGMVDEGPRVKGVRHEPRGPAGHNDLHVRDEPPEHGRNQEDDAAGGPAEGDSGRRHHASASTCDQAGRRAKPLDDHTNKGPELPPGVATGELNTLEQVALQLPTSPTGKVKIRDNNEEPGGDIESAQLRSELREARTLAEKLRGEFSAAQKL